MAFGIYVHIPYCIQRCTYCDFATYEQSKILPPEKYVQLLFEEIRQKHQYYQPQELNTLYFGGGTPSLIPASLIVAIIAELGRFGFTTGPTTEITIEINPATINEDKLKMYLDAGINRFSVGAQTFDDRLLKMVHREHSAQQTLETLDLLRAHNLNYSFDILFAMPTQTFAGLQRDVEIAVDLGARHISPYCLTVPDGHPLSKGRPLEEVQVDMFDLIASKLTANGFKQYEISNFSQPRFESQHNLLYWTDEPYWGLGLSAHSYTKKSRWGTRFWNLSSIHEYQKQIEAMGGMTFTGPQTQLPKGQFEVLEMHQALTDYCHTSMRLMRGLSTAALRQKFSLPVVERVLSQLSALAERNLTFERAGSWALTQNGVVLSNTVFQELTYLSGDLNHLEK